MKKSTICSTCQHLGDAVFPTVKRYVDGEMNFKLVGFSDRPNGDPVDNPSRRCNHPKMAKTLVYEKLEHPIPCMYWEKRNWRRPLTCGECQLHASYGEEYDTVICSGHPFCCTHSRNEKACINGQVEINSQLSLLSLF